MTNPSQDSKTKGKFAGLQVETSSTIFEDSHPCIKEQKLSYKCLDENNYDKSLCKMEFSNYRNCMKFWGSIQLERRRKGIFPLLPLPHEREAIKRKRINVQES